jgi:Tn3 transposase DDE domain
VMSCGRIEDVRQSVERTMPKRAAFSAAGMSAVLSKARIFLISLAESLGGSAYTLAANHVPCNARIIGTHEHESHFVFDTLDNNPTDIRTE